jgi:predicted ATP-binding protein involved in virulence
VVDGKQKFIISGYSFVVDTDVKEEIRVMNRRTVGRGI